MTQTTKQLAARFLANLETRVGQQSPLNDAAFLRVLSGDEALMASGIIKYTQERGKANLVRTAMGKDLENLGAEYEVIIKKAQAAVLNISLPAVNGTIIPQTAVFTGDNNGERYFPDNDATAAGGAAVLNVTAENTGVIGNLNDTEPLTINVQIPGAETVATVLSTVTLGTDEEEREAYRRRVQNAVYKKSGGGNTADHRDWAEAVSGAAAAFPYTGRPFGDITPSEPPDRTVYVQADETIDPDGIAPPALLAAVRDALNTDPETGISRMPLGLTDDSLFVVSISRTDLYLQISDLVTPAGQETQVKTDIENSLITHLQNVNMFVEGLDFEGGRSDEITDLTLSKVTQDVLEPNNSSATAVGFGFVPGAFLGIYKLNPGELVKAVQFDYV